MATKKNQQKEQEVKKEETRPHYYWVRPRLTGDDAYGLSTQGYSKWRDCPDILQCAYDTYSKRWLTGLDENDPLILSIPNEEERIAKQEEVRKLRENLEKLTGYDLSANNDDFWSDYIISLSDKTKPFVPFLNPRDRITIEVLKRRGDIPFGSNDLYNAKYTDAKFYIETEESEQSNKKNRRKLEKQALAASFEMEEDYDKLWKVCFLLQLTKTPNESSASLVGKVDDFIERNKKYPDELERLITLVEMDNMELDTLTYVEKGIKAGVISFSRDAKQYYRGGVSLGESKLVAAKTLSLPDNSSLFGEIVEEVQRKEGFKANY